MKKIKVKVNGHVWDVVLVKPNDERLLSGVQRYDGRAMSYDKEIAIRDDLRKTMFRQVLIHELTHAYVAETDMSQPRQSGYGDEDLATFAELNAESIVDAARAATDRLYD